MKSLESLEKLWFHPETSPFALPETAPDRMEACTDLPGPPRASVLSLDGEWRMARGGEEERLRRPWDDAIAAQVPCSIYTPLMEAGILDDLYVGDNVDTAREYAYSTWWFSRSFRLDAPVPLARLVFEGVANQCEVWLDGAPLGSHEGIFGGPAFALEDLEQGEHRLIVRLFPIVWRPYEGRPWANGNMLHTVTISINHGLHYVHLPMMGLWRGVRLELQEQMVIEQVYATALNESNALAGIVNVSIDMRCRRENWDGQLTGWIAPLNFQGKAYRFTSHLWSHSQEKRINLRIQVPEARLWWPLGQGEPNLYSLRLSFVPSDGAYEASREITFGIRSIRMEEIRPHDLRDHWSYNWKFVVNGRPTFICGQNWGMLDAAAASDPGQYERAIRLAAGQHCNMLRVWGLGPIEADLFYELCDAHGIMVFQEWPMLRIAPRTRPYAMMEETVRLNMLRLRNHPSIVLWCGGNEIDMADVGPCGPIMEMIGRYAWELDGTRPFHLSEPWGGSIHNYSVYWGEESLDSCLRLQGAFLGEFGMASMAPYESVSRFVSKQELETWPPRENAQLFLHLPVFNQMRCFRRISHVSRSFLPQDSLRNWILGSQLGQALLARHVCERARTRWPQACAGVLHYKFNEMYPGASWSVVDFYGIPKIVYYFLQDAFAPLHACLLTNSFDLSGADAELPVYLLDSLGQLEGREWKVRVRAFDCALTCVHSACYEGAGALDHGVGQLGVFPLTMAQAQSAPLLFVTEIDAQGLRDTTFYWMNFEKRPGCLFELPSTRLAVQTAGNLLQVTNLGAVPAVGVHFEGWEQQRSGYLEDSYFWLDAGETRSISTEGMDPGTLRARAFNA